MLLSGAAGSTCSPSVKERRDSIPPGGLERARTSEEDVLVCVWEQRGVDIGQK